MARTKSKPAAPKTGMSKDKPKSKGKAKRK